jgi:hypothetical protein
MFRIKDSYGRPKYVGRSRATVVDNRDPLKRGRILVDSPVLGETVWINYLKLPHQFDVPSIGDVVYVECDGGEYEFAIAWGNITKGLDESPDLPEVFRRPVPTNRGMYTPGGHLLEFDDGESKPTKSPIDTDLTTKNRGIRITSSQNNKIHIIEDDDDSKQYILIEDKNGNMIKLDYKENELTIKSLGKTIFDTAEDRTDTVGGNLTVTVTGDANITADGNVTVSTPGNATVSAAGNATISADGNAEFKGTGGTNVGDAGSTTQVKGSQVMLAGGGPGVARLGDRAFGIGNLGAPVSSTIIQGSTKVLSG